MNASPEGGLWTLAAVEARRARAVAAFALLIRRYTAADEVALEADPAAFTVGFAPELTAGELAALVGASLGRDTWSVGWRTHADHGAEARLSLTVSAGDDGVKLELDGHEALATTLPAEQVEAHYHQLFDTLLAEPDLPVDQVAMLSEAEREQLLGEFSHELVDPTLLRDERLHELFETQVDARPDAPALICGAETLTYRELDRRANGLAAHLRSLGAGPGTYVGLWLPRSADAFVGLLGILKSGAAYVPMDPDYPADRVEFILGDVGAVAVVTASDKAATLNGAVATVELDQPGPWREPADRPEAARPAADDPCYVIYTSGSTGRPKGVLIEHRQACHLVRAEGRLFATRPDDRVFQGFSLAFDASVEEVWLAWFAGGTLVAGTKEFIRSWPAQPSLMADAGVTVLSCVPTQLAMVAEDVPTLRILILGGEKCPDELARRWCRPGLRMVNTYGPTEATVVATYAELSPDRPVTIGRPIPNYTAYLLDPSGQPVPVGVLGELLLGGPGLARGYVNRDDLTADRFIANPFGRGRLYRTGDLARWTPAGDIDIRGRADTQVKLRGYRIELSEIENVLLEQPDVRNAVVALREDTPGQPQLVGYLVAEAGGLDLDAAEAALRRRLPGYMVPAALEVLEALPTLTSGKVDLKRLPPPTRRQEAPRDVEPPRTPRETTLVAAWRTLFGVEAISREDDFFADRGGHSLLAAGLVSTLRKDPAFADLSVLDIYNHPRLCDLAAALDERHAHAAPAAERPAPSPVEPGSNWRLAWCGLGQLAGLYGVLTVFSSQWLTPYLVYCWLTDSQWSIVGASVGALAALMAIYPVLFVLSIVAKWVLIGRYKAGEYPVWGFFYWRWWLCNHLLGAAPIEFLAGTPLLAMYYRALGAKIGRNVYFGTDCISAFDLVTVGDDTCIGVDAGLTGYHVEDGKLKLGPVTVGARCYVGTRSALRLGAVMEDDSSLGDLSLVPEGGRVPAGETWVGSPARPLGPGQHEATDTPERTRPTPGQALGYTLAHALGAFLIPTVYLAAIFPGLVLLNTVSRYYGHFWSLAMAPAMAIVFVVLLCLEIALVKWLLLGRAKPGHYPLHSAFYLRKWFVDQLMGLSLDLVGPIYASLYLPPWFRLLGVKLGRGAEVSTASQTSPDLLVIEEETFIADSVSLGVARVDRGWLHMAETRVGRRSFIGNSAVLPSGTQIGEGSLIGVLSAPPLTEGTTPANSSWLGSPAVYLPQRQRSTQFAEEQTYKPTKRLYRLRLFIEFFRIILPPTIFVMLTATLVSVVSILRDNLPVARLVVVFPVLYGLTGVVATLITIALKWLIMGRYRPQEKPLWCHFVWRTELVCALHEHLANPFLVELLTGTPFLAWFFRAMGSKIGKRVYLQTTEITEYDLVTIGDDACLNDDCTIQTHLFEDRVMKMSTVTIGRGCTVGAGSVVLYDAVMEDGANLGDTSLLLKGERLPADTTWEGTPARRVR